jgi:membrane protease YdiL (CAAX protease family)
MIVAGLLLAVGGLGAASLAISGQLDGDGGTAIAVTFIGLALFAAGLVYVAVRQILQRRVLPPERYRGPSVLLLLVMVLLLGSVLVAPFTSDAQALLGGGDSEPTLFGGFVILVSTSVALLVVTGLFVALPDALANLPSFPGPAPLRAIGMGVGWGAAAWLGSSLLLALATFVLTQLGYPPDPGTAELAVQSFEPWLIVFGVVFVAPIAEEIFFRGVAFNAWLREGGRRYAYIGSAALFAVIHVSLVSLVPIFILGLALAWVYERSGHTLLAPMAMHATVNGISVGLALLVRFEVISIPV